MAFSLILNLPILFDCQFSKLIGSTIRRLRCKKDNWCHRQWQLKTFINNEIAKDEALDFTASLLRWRHKIFFACVFDCYRNFEPIIPCSTFNLWLSKTFDAHSMISILPSNISFSIYQILSSDHKLFSPTFLESRGKISFKGGSLSHPKISISECEPFSQKKLKFSKGFQLFSFKIIFIVIYL
jgi:hypothetical protein